MRLSTWILLISIKDLGAPQKPYHLPTTYHFKRLDVLDDLVGLNGFGHGYKPFSVKV